MEKTKIYLKILSERQSITAARASTSSDARPSTSAAASVGDAIAADENEGLDDDDRTNNGRLHFLFHLPSKFSMTCISS